MLNVIMPMAGRGSRFGSLAESTPKPLMQFREREFFLWALDCLKPHWPEMRVFFATVEEDNLAVRLQSRVEDYSFESRFITLPNRTSGPAETIALTLEKIGGNFPFLSLDCDLYFSCNAFSDLQRLFYSDAFFPSFPSQSPRYSYVTERNGLAVDLREKEVISANAIAGCYGFKSSLDFLNAFSKVKQGNEICVSDVLFFYLRENRKIRVLPLEDYASFGTPEELRQYQDWLPRGSV